MKDSVVRHLTCGAAIVCVGVLAACSSSTDSANSPASTSPSSTRSVPAPAATVSPQEFFTALQQGNADVKTYAFDLEIKEKDTSAGKASGVADMSDAKNTKVRLESELIGEKTTVILDGESIYTQIPSLGDTYFQIDKETALKNNIPGAMDNYQPLTQSEKYKDFTKSIEVVGEEKITDISTTHYRLIVDMEKYADANKVPDALAGASPDSQKDFWIDANNRIIKTQSEDTVQGKNLTTTIQLKDFNKPVSIQIPTADKVKPFADLGRFLPQPTPQG